MKKNILFCILAIAAPSASSQNYTSLSIEAGGNCTHYFLGEKNNNFNYGFSAILSITSRNLKISAGAGYALKSYNTSATEYPITFKREYTLNYLTIPITADYQVFSHNEIFNVGVLFGIEFRHITDYDIKTFYPSGITYSEQGLLSNRSTGLALLTGTTFYWHVSRGFSVALSPTACYILIPDHTDQRPDYRNIPDDKISIAIKLGMEYFFKKIEKD